MVSRFVPEGRKQQFTPPPRRAPSKNKSPKTQDPNANLPLPDLYRRDLSEYSRQGNKLIDYAGNNDKYRYEYTLDDKGRIKSYQAFRKNDGQYRLDDRYLFSYDGDQVASYVREDYDRGGLDYRRTYDLKDFTVQSYDPIGSNEVVQRADNTVIDTRGGKAKRFSSQKEFSSYDKSLADRRAQQSRRNEPSINIQRQRIEALKPGSFARAQSEVDLLRMQGYDVQRFNVGNPQGGVRDIVLEDDTSVRVRQREGETPFSFRNRVDEGVNAINRQNQGFNASINRINAQRLNTNMPLPSDDGLIRKRERNNKFNYPSFNNLFGRPMAEALANSKGKNISTFEERVNSQIQRQQNFDRFIEEGIFARVGNKITNFIGNVVEGTQKPIDINDNRPILQRFRDGLDAPETRVGKEAKAYAELVNPNTLVALGGQIGSAVEKSSLIGASLLVDSNNTRRALSNNVAETRKVLDNQYNPSNEGAIGNIAAIATIGAYARPRTSTNPTLAQLPKDAKFTNLEIAGVKSKPSKIKVDIEPTGRTNQVLSTLEEAPNSLLYAIEGKNYKAMGLADDLGVSETIQTKTIFGNKVTIERVTHGDVQRLAFYDKKGNLLKQTTNKINNNNLEAGSGLRIGETRTSKRPGRAGTEPAAFLSETPFSAEQFTLSDGTLIRITADGNIVTKSQAKGSPTKITQGGKMILEDYQILFKDGEINPLKDVIQRDRGLVIQQGDLVQNTVTGIDNVRLSGSIKRVSDQPTRFRPSFEDTIRLKGKRAEVGVLERQPRLVKAPKPSSLPANLDFALRPVSLRGQGFSLRTAPLPLTDTRLNSLIESDINQLPDSLLDTKVNLDIGQIPNIRQVQDPTLRQISTPKQSIRQIQDPRLQQVSVTALAPINTTLPEFSTPPILRGFHTPFPKAPPLPPNLPGGDNFLARERARAKRARKAGFSPDIISAIEKEIKDTQRTSGTFTGLERRYLPKEFREILG